MVAASVTFAGAASFSGCAGPAPASPGAVSADKDRIWALEREYWESNRAADTERISSAWHEAFLGWPQGEPVPLDKEEATSFARRSYSKPGAFTFELEPAGIRIHGDVAVVHYTVRLASKDGEGRETRSSLRITHTLVREGGAWKILGGLSTRE